MKKLILIASLLFLTSCSYYRIRFVDRGDGPELKGRYNELTPTIEVTMPGGEKLTGDDVSYEKISIGKSSLFYESGPKSGIVGPKPGTASRTSVNRYARLTGNRGTVMEIIFRYNILAQQGYGWAKTSEGRDYDVFFSHTKITVDAKK